MISLFVQQNKMINGKVQETFLHLLMKGDMYIYKLWGCCFLATK